MKVQNFGENTLFVQDRIKEGDIDVPSIAAELGVSRTRVYQIIARLGHSMGQKYASWRCRQCGMAHRGTPRAFCSRHCGEKYYHPTLVCAVCGNDFTRKRGLVRYRYKMFAKQVCGIACRNTLLADYARMKKG
mgnify:FL=1